MRRILFYFLVLFFCLNGRYLYATKYDYKGDCIWHPIYDELNKCLDKELVDYDKKLNALYKETYTGESDVKLKKAEESWIQYKEADCDYIASEVNSGKEYAYIYKACLINKTKERINDLKRSYEFFGWIRSSA